MGADATESEGVTGRRIAVIGVGGIGAYYVARLTQCGDSVLAVARGEHLDAMREGGLTVEHPEYPFRGAVQACSLAQLMQCRAGDFEAVIVLTKATSTDAIAQSLATWMGDAEVLVISLQNGADNEVVLERHLGPRRTVGGYSVRLGGHVVEPGRVRCVGTSETWMGPWPSTDRAPAGMAGRLGTLARRLERAGLRTFVSNDVQREIWRKLVLNAAVNPLSALLGWDTREMSRSAVTRPLLRAIMDETVAVGRASGVNVGEDDASEMLQLITGFPAIKTSMLVDYERGRPLEVDAIAGAVTRRADALGMDVPSLRAVASMLSARLRADGAPLGAGFVEPGLVERLPGAGPWHRPRRRGRWLRRPGCAARSPPATGG